MRNRIILGFIVFGMLLPGPACSKEKERLPPGVVATVNGQNITLRQVESLHDVSGEAPAMAENPSVELLRKQYGKNLVNLIVAALIQQELERRNISITDEELKNAEKHIRADYDPPEEFEKELQEEYLDLDTWRELMRQRLSVQRFQEQVLRPRFSITADEIKAFFAENKTSFEIPAQIEILWAEDEDKTRMEALKEQWNELIKKGNDSIPTTVTGFPPVLRISPQRLPIPLRKDLTVVKPGQSTPIRYDGEVHQFAVLLQHIPARKLTVVEAYPLVEQMLMEEKLEPAYTAWLQEALTEAVIHVAPDLYPGKKVVAPDSSSVLSTDEILFKKKSVF